MGATHCGRMAVFIEFLRYWRDGCFGNCVVRCAKPYVPHTGTYGTSASSAAGLGCEHVPGWNSDITCRRGDRGLSASADGCPMDSRGCDRYQGDEAAVPGAEPAASAAICGWQAAAREAIQAVFEKDSSKGLEGFQPCSVEKSGSGSRPRSSLTRLRRSTVCGCATCRPSARSGACTVATAAGLAFLTV